MSIEHAPTLDATIASGEAEGPAGALVAGRYRLLELIGSGGMGTVYKAHDAELDEVVALKTVRRELVVSPGALERFKREVKLARKVTHRAIARVFDVGETGSGEKFLTMELVVGRSLARVLAERGPLSPAEAIAIGTAVAEGLVAAHAAGVVHRDLKPDNVLIEDSGRVVITDFGIACAIEDARATAAGAIVGTPGYMAPEQVDGSPIDGRTDLYAFGVMLFEMLAGGLPFEGETPIALAAARLLRPPRDLAKLRSDVPAALAEVVRRALSRAPADRFQTAEAMGQALGNAVSTTTLTRPATPNVPAPRVETEHRLAVVPFRSSGDDDDWMAEGITEDLGDALSLLHGVRVRSRAGMLAKGEDLRDYARRNGVDALVEGSVRRDGEGFRATIRLVSAQDGFQIWAQRFVGASRSELLRVSDDAARAIAHALAGASTSARDRAVVSDQAVELFLRAKRTMKTFPRVQGSRELLEQARVLAPNDPAIIAASAISCVQDAFRAGSRGELFAHARELAQRALELSPHLPESHLAIARVRHAEGDDVGAVEALLVARRNGPGVADVDDLLGRILAECDLEGEAMAHLSRAVWIDPALHWATADMARLHALAGRWDDVERCFAELRAQGVFKDSLQGSRLALWSGRRDFAESPPSTSPNVLAYTTIARAILDGLPPPLGELDKLRAFSVNLPRRSRPHRVLHQIEAELFGHIGDVASADRALGDAIESGLSDLAWLRRCPEIALLRGLPTYAHALTVVEASTAPVIAAYRDRIAAEPRR